MSTAPSLDLAGRGSGTLPLQILAFCLLWSSAFTAAKVTLLYCPPLLLLTARFLLAATAMFALLGLRRGEWRMRWRDVAVFAGLGLNYVGMVTTSSGITAIISSANPVLTALLAAVFLDERLTGRKIAGLLLGVGGVAVVVRGRIRSGLEDPVGICFTLA